MIYIAQTKGGRMGVARTTDGAVQKMMEPREEVPGSNGRLASTMRPLSLGCAEVTYYSFGLDSEPIHTFQVEYSLSEYSDTGDFVRTIVAR